jgi:hypothetical protein
MSFELSKLIETTLRNLRKDFSGSDEEFEKKIDDKFPELIQILGDTFKQELLKQYQKSILQNLKKQEDGYEKNLYKDYKEAFDLFQVYLDLNKYCGKRTLEELEKRELDFILKYHILFRIHSRCCQIGYEVLTLLRKGYPDGAQARWRTLHELTVIFTILNDNPVEITNMFIDYDVIEKVKRAKDFEEQRHKINWAPLDEVSLKELHSKKEELIKKYGTEFTQSYGWTMNILPKGKRNFRELETLACLDYMRPFYSWANNNIHSGIGGLISRMGQIEDGRTSYLSFAGPSFYGFADPAQFTTTSLLTISRSLLLLYDDLESQIMESLLTDLDNEIKKAFFYVNDKFKNDYFEK